MSTNTVLRAVGILAIAAAVVMMLNSTLIRAYLGGADSQLKLAYAYGTGSGVEMDQEKAIKWYRKAAEQGDPRGQMVLAARYDTGEGLPLDPIEATKWYERAATSGDGVAQLRMAERCYEGKGVRKDDVQAAMWLILSDQHAVRREDGVRLLEALKASLSEEQLAEARRLAADWRAANPDAVRARENESSG